MSSEASLRLARRRNGRQQACEPCQRRKVACDHRLPVCSRCMRGRNPDACSYLPERRVGAATHASQEEQPHDGLRQDAPDTRETYDTPPKTPRSSVCLPGRPDEAPGFLGATNYSAVFKETEARLSSFQSLDQPDEVVHGADEVAEILDKATLEMAVGILRSIPDRETCSILTGKALAIPDGLCNPAIESLLVSLWSVYGSNLKSNDDHSLGVVVEKFCQSTSETWIEDEDDPEEWYNAFSGENFRWESLGSLFICFAYGILAFPDDGSLGERIPLPNADRSRLKSTYKACAWKCAELARRYHSCNTLVLWVLMKHSLLESLSSGDGSMENWRLFAEAIGVTTFLGLHNCTKPYFDRTVSVQVKRRLFVMIYNCDKSLARFTGRPPLLMQRFCSTPLPLDISDAELFGREPPAVLDEDGWSQAKIITTSTVARISHSLAAVLEGLLEIALQPPNKAQRPKLLSLRKQEAEAVSRIPANVVYQPGEENTVANFNSAVLAIKIYIRLEHLYNVFLLERLLGRLGAETSTTLVEISYQLVTTTLMPWKLRERMAHLQNDLEWLVMQYAAPASGVLCLELLRPQVLSKHALSITKADIVQLLSILICALDCVRPGAPNATMCRNVKKVVRQVLNEVINGPPSTAPESGDATDAFTADLNLGLSDDMSKFFSLESMGTYDWVDSYDWFGMGQGQDVQINVQ